MVLKEPLMQKDENMICFLRKYLFFTGHICKTLDFNGSQRFTSPVKENIRYFSFMWCEPLWTVVKICFLWVVTVPENCCIVSDSLCHGRNLLLSSITGFVISQIIQTNFANQNLHGHKLGLYLAVLPYKHDWLFSNVCGLNLCLARPLNIAAH